MQNNPNAVLNVVRRQCALLSFTCSTAGDSLSRTGRRHILPVSDGVLSRRSRRQDPLGTQGVSPKGLPNSNRLNC
eukprot:3330547-Amphidinium_carterae.1